MRLSSVSFYCFFIFLLILLLLVLFSYRLRKKFFVFFLCFVKLLFRDSCVFRKICEKLWMYSDIIYSRHKFFSSFIIFRPFLTWISLESKERLSINSSKKVFLSFSFYVFFLYNHFLVLCRYRCAYVVFSLDDDPG